MNYSLGYDDIKYGTELNGKPVEYDFKVSRSQGGYTTMPTVKELFERYPGVKIRLVSIENTLKNKVVETESGRRPMTRDDVKNVVKLSERVMRFLTKEE